MFEEEARKRREATQIKNGLPPVTVRANLPGPNVKMAVGGPERHEDRRKMLVGAFVSFVSFGVEIRMDKWSDH